MSPSDRGPGAAEDARQPTVEEMESWFLDLVVPRQPDEFTCGPTCLQAVYSYYGDALGLEHVIAGVETTIGGGTLAVNLACHALKRGYEALIYTYNLTMFDPTWFEHSVDTFLEKLRLQQKTKADARLQLATHAYVQFLEWGGQLRFEELTEGLLRRHLSRGEPILAGLSATYLYSCAREYREEYDDIRGEPTGHFVVLSGYDRKAHQVLVADPLYDNPRFSRHLYRVSAHRLIAAVHMGVLTYDANLLVLKPRRASK